MINQEQFLINCRRDWLELYNGTIKEFRQVHFLLNTGSGAALATFIFSQLPEKECYLIAAVIFFAIGIVFSTLAYLFEAFFFYRKLNRFDQYFLPSPNDSESSIDQKVKEYISYQEATKKSDKHSALFRGVWGIICYIWFLLGITCVLLQFLT